MWQNVILFFCEWSVEGESIQLICLQFLENCMLDFCEHAVWNNISSKLLLFTVDFAWILKVNNYASSWFLMAFYFEKPAQFFHRIGGPNADLKKALSSTWHNLTMLLFCCIDDYYIKFKVLINLMGTWVVESSPAMGVCCGVVGSEVAHTSDVRVVGSLLHGSIPWDRHHSLRRTTFPAVAQPALRAICYKSQ